MTLLADREHDHFLAYPPLQPKRQIAEYVASKGVSVPARFENLAAALASDKPFLLRSEHPQDYAGSSGLGSSIFIRPEDCSGNRSYEPLPTNIDQICSYRTADLIRTITEITSLPQKSFERRLIDLDGDNIAEHCKITGMDQPEFEGDFSFSYWEGLGGINRAIVADNTIEDRYHIFTYVHAPRWGIMYFDSYGYQMIEAGKIIHQGGSKSFSPAVVKDFGALIKFYETVRKLDKFDPNHCPIIETQTVADQFYFLQYHRTRDKNPATFTLDRNLQKGEIPALFVRGATPPEGLELQLGIHYSTTLPQERLNAGIDWNSNPLFSEALARRRRLHLIGTVHNMQGFLTSNPGHLQRSQLFKAETSMVIAYNDWRMLKEDVAYEGVSNPIPTVDISVVSDGRQGYIRRI